MFGWSVLLLWSLALLAFAAVARMQGFDSVASPTFFIAQIFLVVSLGGLAFQWTVRFWARRRTTGKL